MICRAELTDVRELNSFINRSGGIPVLKQAFGAFNTNSLIENCHLTLLVKDPQTEKCIGCLTVNDSVEMSAEVDSFELKLELLNKYMPVTVRCFIRNV